MKRTTTAAVSLALFSGLFACRGVCAAANDKTYEQLKLLVDVLGYIQDNYVDEPDTQKLIYGAASGMAKYGLDPFSQFMEPEIHGEIKTETEGQFGGIGIRIAVKEDDWLTVVTPLPGTPAYRMGILPNDRIADIDGQPSKEMSLPEALKKLRGSPGTTVKLVILRAPDKGDGAWISHEFTIAREIIKIESVQSRMLESQVGYARIIEFSARTAEDFLSAMKDLQKKGMTSLVLDLRNNPGGLLSAAVEVASDFLGENKLVVYTQGRKPENRQEFRATGRAPYPSLPLVVLVNEGSASGSEIVAGAFQDHRRALIMGMRSYGKASVQSVIPLPDGSGLRLTVARYYTPLGRSIHRDEKHKDGGIAPDIVVPVSHEMEAKLYSQYDVIYAKDKKPRPVVQGEEAVRDETLERAVELLKARDVLGALKVQD
ncbi:MAG: S41 family peptidase [Elusimicrobia bacterium]|nr:S41 family peptidase [Elusimicrobiota bacterium]